MVVKYLKKIARRASHTFSKTKVVPLNSEEDLPVFQISGMDGKELSNMDLFGSGEFTTSRSDLFISREDTSSIHSSESSQVEEPSDGFLLESIKASLKSRESRELLDSIGGDSAAEQQEVSEPEGEVEVKNTHVDVAGKLEIAHRQLSRAKDSSEEISVRKVSHATAIDLYKQVFLLGSSNEAAQAAMGLKSAYIGVRDELSPGKYTDFIIPYDNIKLNFWSNISKLTGEIGHELSCELSIFASKAKLLAILHENLLDNEATVRNAESFHEIFDQDCEAIATALILRKLGMNSSEYSVNDLIPYLDIAFDESNKAFVPSGILGEYFHIIDSESTSA